MNCQNAIYAFQSNIATPHRIQRIQKHRVLFKELQLNKCMSLHPVNSLDPDSLPLFTVHLEFPISD